MLTPGPAVVLHENLQYLKPLFGRGDEEYSKISNSVINTIADLVDCHPAVVMDCVSFYTMLYIKPPGRHIIQVCQTLSCSLNGADELVDYVTDKYKIKPGETASSMMFEDVDTKTYYHITQK